MVVGRSHWWSFSQEICILRALVKLLTRDLHPTSTGEAPHKKCGSCTHRQLLKHTQKPQDSSLHAASCQSTCDGHNITRTDPVQTSKAKRGRVSSPVRLLWDQWWPSAKTNCVESTGILLRPKFLIFDEPTNHLDIETVEALAKWCGVGVTWLAFEIACQEVWLCQTVRWLEGV